MSQGTPTHPTAHIRFQSWEEFGAFLGQSGGSRGLFVRADRPPAIGTEIGVHFVLPDGSDLLLSGRVVHAVNALEAEALGEEPGMGVQFTHMSQEQGRQLQELMVKALNAPSLAPPARARGRAPDTALRESAPVRDPFAGPRTGAPRSGSSAPPSRPPQHTEPRAPDNDPRLHEASALLERSRYDAAEQAVAEVLRERPSSFEGRVILFSVQARRAASQFDFQTAIDKYRALLQLDPGHADARAQIALLQREAETSKALVERVFGSDKRKTR